MAFNGRHPRLSSGEAFEVCVPQANGVPRCDFRRLGDRAGRGPGRRCPGFGATGAASALHLALALAAGLRARHNCAVASRDMSPLKELLPSVLAQVARDTGRARQLKPLWDDAVGPAISRCASPLSLEGKTLVVSASSPRWAAELQGREGELLKRLEKKLGKGAVTGLRFCVSG